MPVDRGRVVEIKDVIEALKSSAARRNVSLIPHPSETADGRVLFSKHSVNVFLTPVMHTNEIEVSAEIKGVPGRISGDTIQAWLGEPIHAYMFSDKTVEKVSDDIIDSISRLYARFQNNFELAIEGLEATSRMLSEESERNWLREEADKAWKSRRYNETIALYDKLGNHLSASEEKRVKIARQMSK